MGDSSLRLRRSARVILINRSLRVLMFRFDIPGRPPFWVTPGGACDPGETYEDAARRELIEETGIHAEPGPQIAQTTSQFVTPEGELVQADERYFLVRTDCEQIDTAQHTALEQKVMTQHRWFEICELGDWSEALFPETLSKIIADNLER